MASIRKEILVGVPADDAWAAVRDWAAPHERLTPGLIVELRVDSDNARVVTFVNGTVLREVLVDLDDDARRLVWTIVEGSLPLTHHNGAMQILPEGDGNSRLVWTTDLLPHELAKRISDFQDHGMAVIKQTIEAASSR